MVHIRAGAGCPTAQTVAESVGPDATGLVPVW